ncbi:hypothetical protein FF125_05740 [Aureibaculum algae]|uniref:CHRD domain-containing protein n=1 Tax=Aureibaculum algae TaxID=2584122 RepID=A0A5B7TNL8_9FLAO|nr:hypothetical protein [Aureibaculum algae]QCX37958.1 hypothetical protein FF125_05740 [Aureibaculum algae]
MKNTMRILPLAIIMIISSCSSETFTEPLPDKTKSVVVIIDHNDNEIQESLSTLHRNRDGIAVSFKTNGLIPGNVYTLWYVIFGETSGPPTSTYAGGIISDGNGNGNFTAQKSIGEIFNNPLTAEVHLALRTHGQAQPGMIASQIQTMDGGCLLPDIGFPSGPTLHPDSDQLGYCANIQVAMHPAVK